MLAIVERRSHIPQVMGSSPVPGTCDLLSSKESLRWLADDQHENGLLFGNQSGPRVAMDQEAGLSLGILKVHREHRHEERHEDDRDEPERHHQAAVAFTEIGAEERIDSLPLLNSAHHDIPEQEQ